VTVAAPLTFPLAGLLGEPPGASRTFEIEGALVALPEDLTLAEPLEGVVEIARTNRGVLVKADLQTKLAASCARCLRDIEVPIELEIEEEALPSVDIATGLALDRTAEPDVTRLNGHHELEFGPVVADAISLAEPIAPLCEENCPGLCPICGERLGPEHRDHPDDDIDPRLEALRGFEIDGTSESE
jgi:uncharacterized protein